MDLKLSEVLPYVWQPTASPAVLRWTSKPDMQRIIKNAFGILLHKAVGFLQRTKWMTLKLFLDSDMTLRDLAKALNKRWPYLAARFFLKHTQAEERTGIWMDLFEKGLECQLIVTFRPSDPDDTVNKMAAVVGQKFADNQPLTEEEAKHALGGFGIFYPYKRKVDKYHGRYYFY